MAWREDPSRAGVSLGDPSFVSRAQVTNKLLRIGIPGNGINQSNVRESAMVYHTER